MAGVGGWSYDESVTNPHTPQELSANFHSPLICTFILQIFTEHL